MSSSSLPKVHRSSKRGKKSPSEINKIIQETFKRGPPPQDVEQYNNFYQWLHDKVSIAKLEKLRKLYGIADEENVNNVLLFLCKIEDGVPLSYKIHEKTVDELLVNLAGLMPEETPMLNVWGMRLMKNTNYEIKLPPSSEPQNNDSNTSNINNKKSDENIDKVPTAATVVKHETPSKRSREEFEDYKCLSCTIKRRDVVFMDCGHITSCLNCALKISAKGCPICSVVGPIMQVMWN